MRATYADSQTITVLVEENPKRKGTEARKTFTKYAKAKTVGDALRLGITRSALAWDVEHGFIAIKGRK